MAFGNATFTDAATGINSIGGAVNDILTGETQAQGLRIQAEGTQIQSESSMLEAEGSTTEATNYTLAGTLAEQNAQFTAQNTALQEGMAERQIYQGLSTTTAGVGGAGFSNSGSAYYLMSSGQAQGALQKGLIENQGAITEAGYQEQAESYNNLATYANEAATTETTIAGQQTNIAYQENQEANQVEADSQTAALFSGASGAISMAASVATLLV
jgi:hypothetical protein